MAKVTSIQEIFENLDEGFQSDKAEGVDAIFQFDLTGDNGGKYWVKVQNKLAEVSAGEHDSPTMVLTSAADDYIAMINGELAPMTAGEGAEYVRFRLMMAQRLEPLFDDAALDALYEGSGGVCRALNKLAMLALIEGAGRGMARIGAGVVDACAEAF